MMRNAVGGLLPLQMSIHPSPFLGPSLPGAPHHQLCSTPIITCIRPTLTCTPSVGASTNSLRYGLRGGGRQAMRKVCTYGPGAHLHGGVTQTERHSGCMVDRGIASCSYPSPPLLIAHNQSMYRPRIASSSPHIPSSLLLANADVSPQRLESAEAWASPDDLAAWSWFIRRTWRMTIRRND